MRSFPDYAIETAESGLEALELIEVLVAEGIAVPLVITDQAMPGLKGDQFLVELHQRHPQVVNLMLTGQATVAEVSNAINRGNLYRCLSKPWHETDLQRAVSEALQHYQQEQAMERSACSLTEMPDDSLAQQIVSETEQRNRAILAAIPDIMTIISADGHYLNVSCSQFAGETLPLALGVHVTQVLPPEAAHACLTAIQRALETDTIQTHEQQIQFGARIQYEEVRIVPYQTDKVLCIMRDITERKQTEAQLEAQNSLLARIAQGAPLSEILDAVITRIEQQVPGAMGSVLLLDEASCLRHGSAPNLPPAYIAAVDGVRIGDGVGACGTAAYSKQIVVTTDIATDPRWINYKEFTLAHGLRACWSIPLIAADGQVLGTFGLYYAEARTPQGNELEMICQIANIAGIAIERDRSAAQIRRSEEQLRLTLDFTGIGAWSWQPTTGEYTWNGQMSELLELPSGLDNMFEVWNARIHLDDLVRVQNSIQTALLTQCAFAEEYRYQLQDGTWVWRWCKGQGIYTESGEIKRVLGIVQDITERKQAEEALAAIEVQQRSILENIPGFVVQVDRAGKMQFCNRVASGLTLADVLGHSLDEFTAPESRQVQQAALAHVFSTGEVVTIETMGTGDYHRLAHYEVRIAPIYRHGQVEAAILVTTDVTARKQAELALRQNEAKQRALISALPDLIMRISNDGVYLDFFAPNTINLIGDMKHLVGTRVEQSLPSDLAQTRMRAIRTALETGELQVYEQEIWTDGVLHIEECRVVVCGDNEVLLIGRDISERKRTEQALQQLNEELELRVQHRTQALLESQIQLQTKEQFLRGVFEGTGNPIFVMDILEDGTFQYVGWNRSCEWISGVSSTEAIGRSPHQIFTEDIASALIDNYRRCCETGETIRYEEHVSFESGSAWTLTTLTPLRNSKGRIDRIIGSAFDISDRKQAEAQLREQEQFLRSIYEGVQQPIFVGDVLPDHSIRVAGWNPVTARLAGRSSEEIAGKAVEELFPPDQAAEMLDRYAQCITTRQPVTFEERITFSGQIRWMLSTYNPLMDAEGRVHRVVGTVYDITERKQLEQELRQINTELEQRVADRTQELQHAMEAAQAASQAKTTFLANMSHELRTPLNAILGFSQLLNHDARLAPDQQEQVNIINRSGAHLLNLINDVLAMSKIEAGRTTVAVNQFNLREMFRDLEELFRLKAQAKQLSLTMQISATIPQLIQADESKLRQVLINLIGNAIKFTTLGSVTVRVWAVDSPNVQDALDDAILPLNLHFEVEDTGFGIASDERDAVFEPFGQTQTGQSSREGTGLGLPISRQFVQLMGGELNFSSTLGQGTRFYFTLPVEPVAAGDQLSDRQATRVIGLAPDQPSYRILVVEDNADNRRFLVQLLVAVGFEVQAAANGQEAVELWQAWTPHLIWMDLRMPVMDGYTATRQIRRLEQRELENDGSAYSERTCPATKILALTASAFEDDREPILAAGCDDFLFKPITEAAFFEIMAQHLDLTYLYQAQSVLSDRPAEVQTELAEAVRRMPSDWVAQLQYAARIADEDSILSVIHQLPPFEVELINTLEELVSTFQIERLIELTQQSGHSVPSFRAGRVVRPPANSSLKEKDNERER